MATPPPKRKYKDPKTVKKDAYWEAMGQGMGALFAPTGRLLKQQYLDLHRKARPDAGYRRKKKKNGPS